MKRIGVKHGVPFVYSDNGAQLHIRAKDLLPGDVLLSAGKGWLSRLICYKSRGPYSHASLVINQRAVFESLAVGLGPNSLETVRCEIDDQGINVVLAAMPYPVTRLAVFRHRRLYITSPAIIKQALNSLQSSHFGLEYPVEELRQAASRPIWLLPFACAKAGHKLGIKPALVPGKLCSMLAAAFFESVDIRVIDASHDKGILSPTDFARSPNFVFLDRLVVEADPNAQTNESLREELDSLPTFPEEMTHNMTEARRLLVTAQLFTGKE